MALNDRYIRSAPLPLAVASGPAYDLVAASAAFASAVGAAGETLEGRPLTDLFTDPDAVRDRLDTVRSGRLSTSAGPATNHDGHSVLLTVWRLGDPEGADTAGGEDGGEVDVGVLAAAGTIMRSGDADAEMSRTLREVNEALLVTALREEAQAEDARAESEAKSIFLASVSHELRTPLNSILGYADLMEAGVPESLPDSLRSHVDRIQQASRHLLSLIEQIIEASRAEFDEDVRAEPFDLCALLAEVAQLVRPQAEDKALDIEILLPEPELEITTDRKKLRQVVLNLLVNAIKFTDEGRVRLELDASGEAARIRVRDTGIGIDPAHQERIFDRFWQADASSARTQGGMGIGLWVVRTLVEAMGGTIDLESEPGDGTTFEVRLPRVPGSCA